MLVNFKYKVINTGKVYVDDAEVGSIEIATEEIKELIKEFNNVEKFRYGKEAHLRIFESIDLRKEEDED